MMQEKSNNKELVIFIFLIYLLCFQSPLETLNSFFKYIDEITSVTFVICILLYWIGNKKIIIKKNILRILLPLLAFVVSGIIGTIIYNYQNFNLVVIDLFTNIKFYLSIGMGYIIFKEGINERQQYKIIYNVKIISVFLFVLFVVERFSSVFGQIEYRYGIKSAKLFYTHPTYLAGAEVFLIVLLTYFYHKKNIGFIVINLIILFCTMRGKAVGAVIAYILIIYFVVIFRKKINVFHIFLIGISGIYVAWEQLYYYYVMLADKSARSVMTITSFEIMRDYFPFGTGFGTYGSHVASVNYSPVYVKYGFEYVYELRRSTVNTFFDDTFWPIIIGQTGAIGLICYVILLKNIYIEMSHFSKINKLKYASSLFMMAYLIISSTSEPTFNNSISIPLAVMIGIMIREINNSTKKQEMS